MNFIKSSRFSRRLAKVSHPVSKYNESLLANFVRPAVLEYACEVWDGRYVRDIEKLETIQLEAARIVTGLTKFASKDSLYFETG
jgi:hypothetical protein